MSRRGFGNGFASKSTRFSDREQFESAFAPGPGSYAESGAYTRRALSRRGGGGASAAFAPRTVTRHPADRVQLPGPGAYNAHSKPRRRIRARNSAGRPISSSATFRSSTDRFGYGASGRRQDGPAPGQYMREEDPEEERRAVAGAVFRSGTRRGGAEHRDEPGPGSYAASAHGPLAASSPIRNALNPSVRSRPYRSEAVQGGFRVSSMFAASGHDRWGRPLRRSVPESKLPGPGQYSGATETSSRGRGKLASAGATSAFASSARANVLTAKGAAETPGPGVYDPQKVSRRSFFLNTSQRWVS